MSDATFIGHSSRTIPTGLYHSAQGWPRLCRAVAQRRRERTTLGKRSKIFSNPIGVELSRRGLMQPLQGSCRSLPQPRVARSSRLRFASARHAQPWADRFESLQDSPEVARPVAQNCILRMVRRDQRVPHFQPPADCKSAIQQIENLRYLLCVSAPLRLCVK